MGLFLLRDNRPGYANWFNEKQLFMEVRPTARDENAWIKNPELAKCLYWSERGGEYLCLGRVDFVREVPAGNSLGPVYVLQITDGRAPVPRR